MQGLRDWMHPQLENHHSTPYSPGQRRVRSLAPTWNLIPHFMRLEKATKKTYKWKMLSPADRHNHHVSLRPYFLRDPVKCHRRLEQHLSTLQWQM